MSLKRVDEVFGMSPDVLLDSYVDRGALDSELAKLLGRRNHIAIRGPSKCGKSWLRQRAVKNSLTVQCRLGFTNIDIYTNALSDLGIKLTVEESNKHSFKGRIESQVAIGSDLIGKVSAKLGLDSGTETTTKTAQFGRNITDLKFIAGLISESGRRLVIEDIHYLSAEQREFLSFELKTLWDYGCFVVVVGVWGEANMLVHLNSDLSGRIEEVTIEWMPDDLRKIIENGSKALNLKIARDIQNKVIIDCFGNAGLLQRLILKTIDEAKIEVKQEQELEISNESFYETAAMAVADQLNGVYQKFAERVASGIRTRNDSTGIYAHAMAAIINADDTKHLKGIKVDEIFEITHKRQPRIQKQNLKTILGKIDGLQVDKDGRGLVVTYVSDDEKVLNVDRQLLFYRKYVTVNWPWDELIAEAEKETNSIQQSLF
ncbi:hypothetical protein ACO0LD_17670 [Undibacterium sp. Ji83W]|uniref:hypothetical protein n=1 Tax=Undibacterium sp. Ji83W TaxID=3413043 RepID=UPI003BF40576